MMTARKLNPFPWERRSAPARGCGGIFANDGEEEIRGFDPGDVLTIAASTSTTTIRASPSPSSPKTASSM